MTSPDTASSPSVAETEDVTVANRPRAGRPVTVTIAGCVILEELGRGGMGVVYKARQVALNRVAAVKVLHGDRAQTESALRFRLEAETIARLNHPNIIGVHEVGESGGRPYCVLEFAPGGSLDDRIDKGPLDAREAAALVEKIARAVDAAHRAGVVHRDLKPANVLLAEDGSPKVTDFGLAKRLDTAEGLTQTGQVMGTPSYMAPEQAGGLSALVGPATDVYGLGSILYACLSGQPPFRTGSVMQTLDAVRNKPCVPLRRLNGLLPRDLETVAAKCLEKEPARRYASAADLADDLSRYLRGEPVLARRAGVAERLFAAIRRRPTAAAAWALGLLAAALAAVVMLVGDAYRVASRAKDTEEGLRLQADAAREELAAVNDSNQMRLALRLALAGDRDGGRAALARHREEGRGWEWNLIDRLIHPPHEFPTGNEAVSALHFTRDGKELVVGSSNLVIKRYDLAGKVARDFPGSGVPEVRNPQGNVAQVNPIMPYGTALSADGRSLFSAAGGKTLTEWDVEAGKIRRQTKLKVGLPLTSLALHPKRRHVAGGTADGEPSPNGVLAVLDPDTGELVAVASGHAAHVTCVDYCGLSDRLVSGGEDGEVRVWEAEAYKCVGAYSGHHHRVRSVRVRPGREEFASGGADGIVFRRAFRDGRMLSNFAVGKSVSCMAWTPDGAFLAVGRQDGAVVFWQPDSGGTFEIPPPAAFDNAVTALAFRPDGAALAVGHPGLVRVVAAAPPAASEVLAAVDPLVCLDADAGVAVGWRGNDTIIYRRDGGQLKPTRNLGPMKGGTTGAALHVASRSLARVGHEGVIEVLDTDTGALRATAALPVGGWWRPRVEFSPDGKTVFAYADRQQTRSMLAAWRVGGPKPTVVEVGGGFPHFAASPDGSLVALATAEAVTLFRTDGLERLPTAERTNISPQAIAFAPDGKTFAFVGFDNITVYSAETGEVVTNFRAPTSVAACYTPDSRRLVTIGQDHHLRVWDPARGDELYAARVGLASHTHTAWGDGGRALYLYGDSPDVQVVRAERATLPPFVSK